MKRSGIVTKVGAPSPDPLAGEGIAFVPCLPLGGFSPLEAASLDEVAERLEATPMAVALAWLLHRSPNILLIPAHRSSGTCARTLPPQG